MQEKVVFKRLLGEWLRQRRRERNMTLRELGNMADLDDNYIGKIERGEKIPSLYTFYKLSDPLDLNSQFFPPEVKEAMDTELY
ncbi:helix-turn-helix domain-containing protein [Sediminibacillus halophilus]|uniref:Helix-turn-helix n=1 Tax=Sediminibacillus halophilus TaxID=482461 RepID=A0A1G9UEK5_9BACI|nr:helix-turn-helix transcriptional regulator [Sediminibacillus halophilus]SDM58359.1 Helix-turn-helix [Sediminibacillus halophilus]